LPREEYCDEKAIRKHVHDARWGDAGSGRARGGSHRRLHARRLVGQLLGQLHGADHLIQTLLKEGLIDELQIWTVPVVLGTGKRLFGEGTVPSALKLIDSKTATTGVLITRYQPAGDIPYGTFQMQNPSEAELKGREKVTREG
jgi:hypothetical protein